MKAVIVDYDICNMFSVKQACERVGFDSTITADIKQIESADLVVLPGIGAFGDAMSALKRLDLIEPLKNVVAQDKPLVGICLGLQLLMSESCEFGNHKGLNIIPGSVKKFDHPKDLKTSQRLKVPHIGWNRIHTPFPKVAGGNDGTAWNETPLNGIDPGEHFYFVHSYYVEPETNDAVLCRTTYGNYDFCSGVRLNNVFAFQFHPERSGPAGMQIYQNMMTLARQQVAPHP